MWEENETSCLFLNNTNNEITRFQINLLLLLLFTGKYQVDPPLRTLGILNVSAIR